MREGGLAPLDGLGTQLFLGVELGLVHP
jgi:hypothetical protein